MTESPGSAYARLGKVEAARRRIHRELARGPRPASEVTAALRRAGIADRTRKRAKSGGAYVTRKIGSRWWWGLPNHVAELDSIARELRKGATSGRVGKEASDGEARSKSSKKAIPADRKRARPRSRKSARRDAQVVENRAEMEVAGGEIVPALARMHTREEILMPRKPRRQSVRIRDPLASATAEELDALFAASPGLVFAGATLTARPGTDASRRAECWGEALASTAGGVWLVAEHDAHLHFHGVVAAAGVAEMAGILERAAGGSADAQHLDPISDREHLRRVVRYATKRPTWDPDEVVVHGVFVRPWARACQRSGVRREVAHASSAPPIRIR